MNRSHHMHYAASGDCTEAQEYLSTLLEDPMSEGAPVDEILSSWLAGHIRHCKACEEATVEASCP